MTMTVEHPWDWADIPPLDDRDAPALNGHGGSTTKAQKHVELVEHHAAQIRARREAEELVAGERLTVVNLETVTATEFLTMEFPDEPMVVDRFAVHGGNTAVFAPKKTGKTTFAGNLARSLVEAVPFLDVFPVAAPQRTYLMNLEMSDQMLQGWIGDIGLRPDARELLVVSKGLRGRSLPLTSPAVRRLIAKILADNGVDVWLLDCMRPLIAACGYDENDNAEISRLLLYVDEIKQDAGCATAIAFHHTGKGEVEEGRETGRGASAWGDWPDIQVFLTKDKAGARYVRTEGRVDDIDESRLGYSTHTRRLYLAGEGESRQDARLAGAANAVVQAVQTNPGINKTGLERAIHHAANNTTDKDAAIGEALRLGRIHYLPGPNRQQLHYPGPKGHS